MVFMLMAHFGGAGHSYEIAKRLSNKGKLIGIDRDEEALDAAKERLKDFEPKIKEGYLYFIRLRCFIISVR